MATINVHNNNTNINKRLGLDLNDKLARIRTILVKDGIMQEDNSFLSNDVFSNSRSQEDTLTLGEFLGEFNGDTPTLVVGYSREILRDEDVTEDITNMELAHLKVYFDKLGLYRGLIFSEDGVAKSLDNLASWDMTEVKFTQPTPVTKKRTEATYTEVGKSMKKTGVIAASVSLDTPFGGGEAGYKKQQEIASNSSSIKQSMVSKFVVQKMMINIYPEDIRIDPSFEREIADALAKDPDEGVIFYSQLLKILDKWGYYVPAGVLLGGMLYATEEVNVSSYEESESESTEFSAAVKASFKGFGGGASFSKADGTETSEHQTTKYEVSEFTQVGGIKTAIAGTGEADFATWSESLRNPTEWDVVEYTNLIPSLALLKDKNLARACTRIIADNSTRRSVRNIQKVLEVYDYALATKRLLFQSGQGI